MQYPWMYQACDEGRMLGGLIEPDRPARRGAAEPCARPARRASTAEACVTVSACVARLREVADPSTGITFSERGVAERLQALSPQSIAPVVSLLQDPDRNVRELAGYVLRDMPGLGPGHLVPLERAVEAGDGWLPPAIASIGTPEAVRFLVDQLKKKPETDTQLTSPWRGWALWRLQN